MNFLRKFRHQKTTDRNRDSQPQFTLASLAFDLEDIYSHGTLIANRYEVVQGSREKFSLINYKECN